MNSYVDNGGRFHELPLTKCVEIWGWSPPEAGLSSSSQDATNNRNMDPSATGQRQNRGSNYNNRLVKVNGYTLTVPRVPRKLVKFLRSRQSVYREIRNMSKVGYHANVIHLKEVLELVNRSGTKIFLVLELANGGELFGRITVDHGTNEDNAQYYLRQLLNGIAHCHERGVCHRDLKPENLLLADMPDDDSNSSNNGNGGQDGSHSHAGQDDIVSILKIADFGFSAHFYGDGLYNTLHNQQQQQQLGGANLSLSPSTPSNNGAASGLSMRRLTSVVGSPHYVAPEVITASSRRVGYDGTKADVWYVHGLMNPCINYISWTRLLKSLSVLVNISSVVPLYVLFRPTSFPYVGPRVSFCMPCLLGRFLLDMMCFNAIVSKRTESGPHNAGKNCDEDFVKLFERKSKNGRAQPHHFLPVLV